MSTRKKPKCCIFIQYRPNRKKELINNRLECGQHISEYEVKTTSETGGLDY